MAPTDLDAPELFINRELSWLEFNERVLQQGCDAEVPLLERLKFLAIVSSNLDEFFMIRVAGLRQVQESGRRRRDPSGLTAREQLARIGARAHRMVADQNAAISEALRELRPHGLRVARPEQLTDEQRRFLDSHFGAVVEPALTPLAAAELDPFPVLPGLALNVAVQLAPREGEAEPRVAIIPLPGALPRFVGVPSGNERLFVTMEDLICRQADRMFPADQVTGTAVFRLTRDADVAIDDDSAGDLLETVEAAVRERRRRSVVRLEVSARAAPSLRDWLTDWYDVEEADAYDVRGLLGARALMALSRQSGLDGLRQADWPPQRPRDLLDSQDLWESLQERNVLLSHPYESFAPVVELVRAAADDPHVLAIKQTLYRTSNDSPIVEALARAAESGKQVTVLVELKARFDEARNVVWSRRLEEAGCHVIYGVAGLKTHAKALLIVRRERHGIRRYVHLSTGNYNDTTARLYADVGMMTSDRSFAADAAAFFNLLTGYSQEVGWLRFAISPHGIRQRMAELIEREAQASTLDQPGLIMAKVNGLQDKAICQALYHASEAGVNVRLNVRGICCLRPGLPGVSENIEVVSIVDRFLEHARIFYFRNGGREEVYMSSADWMGRNLDRRLELLFPVPEPEHRDRLIQMLELMFADNVKAWRLRADGAYERVRNAAARVRAQEELYRRACEAAAPTPRQALHFRPLARPQQ